MNSNADRVYDLIMVDDEEITVELVARKLRNSNLHMKSFTNEISALTYLQNHAARVLIVDQRMPRLDGLDLLQALASGNGIPANDVYLTSATDLPEDLSRRAHRLGVKVLSKDVFRSRQRLESLFSDV